MIPFVLLLTFCVHIQALPVKNFCKKNVGLFRKHHLSALHNDGVLFKIVSYDETELEIKNSTPVGRYFDSSQLNMQIIFYEIDHAFKPENYQLEAGSYKAYSAEAFLISKIQQNDFTLQNNLACAFKGENLKVHIYTMKDLSLGSNIVLFGACRLLKVRSGAVITDKSLIVLVYNYIEVSESEIIKLIQTKVNKLSLETFKSVEVNYEGFCGCRQVSFYIQECTSISTETNNIFWILVAVFTTFGLSWIIKACFT